MFRPLGSHTWKSCRSGASGPYVVRTCLRCLHACRNSFTLLRSGWGRILGLFSLLVFFFGREWDYKNKKTNKNNKKQTKTKNTRKNQQNNTKNTTRIEFCPPIGSILVVSGRSWRSWHPRHTHDFHAQDPYASGVTHKTPTNKGPLQNIFGFGCQGVYLV